IGIPRPDRTGNGGVARPRWHPEADHRADCPGDSNGPGRTGLSGLLDRGRLRARARFEPRETPTDPGTGHCLLGADRQTARLEHRLSESLLHNVPFGEHESLIVPVRFSVRNTSAGTLTSVAPLSTTKSNVKVLFISTGTPNVPPSLFNGTLIQLLFTDCGLGSRVHAELAWAKLRALVEGAQLASKNLWRR